MLKQHDFKQPRNADKVQSELKTETEIESAGITALRFLCRNCTHAQWYRKEFLPLVVVAF